MQTTRLWTISVFSRATRLALRRERFSTGTPWEAAVGYSRAVRVGPFIHVTGTLAANEDGSIIGVDDPYTQTMAAFDKIERAIHDCGLSGLHYLIQNESG